MNTFDRLKAPFPPSSVHWRVGSTNKDKTNGLALAYLDARDVMERLDEVVGPDRWQNRYPHANGKTVCEIGIKIGDEWIWKADGSGDTDVEAEKGALSDAFKRAAVRWGIGQYLYGLGNVWVEIEPFGRSYKIKDSEKPKLVRSLPNAPVKKAQDAQPNRDDDKGPSAIAETLKKTLAMSKTEADLDTWGRHHSRTIKGLPQGLQDDVMAAGTKHRTHLRNLQAEAV